jgi:hypothetical protein
MAFVISCRPCSPNLSSLPKNLVLYEPSGSLTMGMSALPVRSPDIISRSTLRLFAYEIILER